MNKFILKSLANSLLANLPKLEKKIIKFFDQSSEKYSNDYVIVIAKQNNKLMAFTGTINDENYFEQKKIEFDDQNFDSVELSDFLKDQINKTINES